MPQDSTPFQVELRQFRSQSGLTQYQLGELLGVGGDYISQLELGKKKPSTRLERLLELYRKVRDKEPGPQKESRTENTENVTWIPIVTWAQAGIATAFENIPDDWQDRIPVVVSDKQAFAIRLRGDSMEPQFKDGDLAVILPNIPVRHGDLVVANIIEEGFAFKIFSLVGGDPTRISLRSYNPAYGPMEFAREQFYWIYPVDSVIKKIRR